VAFLYAMSDIHGCYEPFIEALGNIDLSNGENRLFQMRTFLANFVTRVEVSKTHITVELLYKDEYGNPFMQNYPCSQNSRMVGVTGWTVIVL
jgi:hypothetical protein